MSTFLSRFSFIFSFSAATLSFLLLTACGPTATTGPIQCAKTCDCPAALDGPTPDCVGEVTCGADKTCQWTCTSSCSGQVSTCKDGSECNGTICSFRKVEGCP